VTCPDCQKSVIPFDIPDAYQEHVPGESNRMAVCPQCLSLESSTDDPATLERLTDVSPSLPERTDAVVPLILAIGLLDSFALNREGIEELLEAVEAEGIDPLIVLDRLASDPDLDPAVDITRRRSQIEQVLR